MQQLFLASTLGNDPHTQGLHIASKIAKRVGISSVLLPPCDDYSHLSEEVGARDPDFLGLSYRLSPAPGFEELKRCLAVLGSAGLLRRPNGMPRRVGFSGLPATLRIIREAGAHLPCSIILIEPGQDLSHGIGSVLDFFEIREQYAAIIAELTSELEPPRIAMLDQLADEVVFQDRYLDEPPLPFPSPAARADLRVRIRESEQPLIRSHFGIPGDSIQPTVEGIRELAEARVLDEISLGSSDLSQRFFGRPEMFAGRKNDGGVPYKNAEDLRTLVQASRCGNFPSVKPYAHVAELVPFIECCLQVGALKGAHQAIPLFWFNELDGRGPTPVPASIREHFAAVRELALRNIPVEMNDPNQWSSRWAHDTIIVADYGLISAVMTMAGVKDMVLQMQFNKPRETGDFGDLAKMTAGLEVAKRISHFSPDPPMQWRETRTGIESLSPDLDRAKRQLARSTLLQMLVAPHMLHLVSYCEANYPARPSDIIDSSKLIRRAAKVFRQHKNEIKTNLKHPLVVERRNYLLAEAEFLLEEIAKLGPDHRSGPLESLAPSLANPEVISQSLSRRLMTAPGIVHPEFKNPSMATKPTPFGFIDVVDDRNGERVITERERLLEAKSLNR